MPSKQNEPSEEKNRKNYARTRRKSLVALFPGVSLIGNENCVQVKVCMRPEKSQSVKRTAMRAGLELFAKHCELFSEYLLKGKKDYFVGSWCDRIRRLARNC